APNPKNTQKAPQNAGFFVARAGHSSLPVCQFKMGSCQFKAYPDKRLKAFRRNGRLFSARVRCCASRAYAAATTGDQSWTFHNN
ncbi:MAG TPA: hypothetical protein PKG54_13365, partial [Phycisphaerae bacterium]|nr:hypothetical protein [Phycisphaerae bacterium]